MRSMGHLQNFAPTAKAPRGKGPRGKRSHLAVLRKRGLLTTNGKHVKVPEQR